MSRFDPSRLTALQEAHRIAVRSSPLDADTARSDARRAALQRPLRLAIGVGLCLFVLTISTYQRQLDEIVAGGSHVVDQVQYSTSAVGETQNAQSIPEQLVSDTNGDALPVTAADRLSDKLPNGVAEQAAAAADVVPPVPHNHKLAPSDSVYAEDLTVADQGVPPHLATSELTCGCPNSCDAVAIGRTNKVYTCQKRVQHLVNNYRMNETDACLLASVENDGGPCGLECHPQHCHNLSAAYAAATPPYLEPLNWTKAIPMDRPDEPFVRYDKVVVATKVLWPNDVFKLKQMICLFTAAYNRHVNYDIVIFTTIPWKRSHLEELRKVAPQTKITVVRDSPPLQDQLATLTADELTFLRERCSVKEGENLTWFHHCTEPGFKGVANLGYSWQAEFRSYHIWSTPVLADYKYMIWMDGDSFCTKPWAKDPMKAMVENDLVLMVNNFPQGYSANPKLADKMRQAYNNRSICSLYMSSEGRFSPRECEGNQSPKVGLVHGFMHITSLDFYRNATTLHFLGLLVGDHRFSREWDDQLAVTAPAAMAAPERVWDLRMNGYNLGIHHNGNLDGKERNAATRYNTYWEKEGRAGWETGREMCDAAVLYADYRGVPRSCRPPERRVRLLRVTGNPHPTRGTGLSTTIGMRLAHIANAVPRAQS
jgi:hypothetical protein